MLSIEIFLDSIMFTEYRPTKLVDIESHTQIFTILKFVKIIKMNSRDVGLHRSWGFEQNGCPKATSVLNFRGILMCFTDKNFITWVNLV